MKRRGVVAVLLAASVLAFVPAPVALAAPGTSSAPAYYFDQWGLPQLWASGARGQGITIAEIDTGVDGSLPIFDGRVEPGIDFGSLGGDGRIDRDKDVFGHGTSMASIMVGRPGAFDIQGIAPGATLLPVAIPLGGTTDAAPDDRLASAIQWSADHGAKIISMSLGGARRPAQFRTACPDDEQQAIFHALRKGALVFAASGNRGTDGSPVEEPSVCLGVVSVGAVDHGAVADFSSRHRYLTLSAPGVSIPSIAPGGTPYAGDGTSQATAIASAATALVWSRYPALTSAQVLTRVLATLDRPTSATHDPGFGYGIINPERAILASVPRTAANPVFAGAQPFLRQPTTSTFTAPAAIAQAARPPGRYSVGAAPRLLAPRVVAGLVVAAAGLVLLLILVVGGRISLARRRRAARAARPPSLPSGPAYPPPAIPAPPASPWQHEVWAPEPHRPRPE